MFINLLVQFPPPLKHKQTSIHFLISKGKSMQLPMKTRKIIKHRLFIKPITWNTLEEVPYRISFNNEGN